MRTPIAIVLLTATLAACSSSPEIDLYIIVVPDADPFFGVDAATQARVTIEDDVTPVATVDIDAGAFMYNISPNDPSSTSRLRVDALNAGRVVGTGITPPATWGALGGQVVSVLIQAPDSVVIGPGVLSTGRSDFLLLYDGYVTIYAVTLPDGATTNAPPDGYNLLTNGRIDPGLPQLVPAWCDGDCSIVPVSDGWLLVRGLDGNACSSMAADGGTPTANSAVYVGTDVNDPGTATVPASRCPVLRSTEADDVFNAGGWLLGGHDSTAPLNSVDYVTSITAADGGAGINWSPTDRLVVARDAPQLITLAPQSSAAPNPLWLVVGGQDPTDSTATQLELYQWGAGTTQNRAIPTSLDVETGAAAACVTFDDSGNCTVAMLVGGQVGTSGTLSMTDAIIDANCAEVYGAGCNVVATTGSWLAHPRWGARAVLVEGGTLLVSGGFDASGPVYDVEAVDVSGISSASSAAPAIGHVVATLPCSNPSVLGLINGQVMIAGGTDAMGNACTQMYFYRGPRSL